MNYNTVNIFSDASVLGKINKEHKNRVCAGAVAVVNGKRDKEYHLVIEKSTNNYGELSALFLAIQLASEYTDLYNEINIFSDSNISVKGMRQWIYNWMENMSDGVLYSYTGSPVANQDVIKAMYDFIISKFDPMNVKIKIHHVKGHVTNGSDILKAIRCIQMNFTHTQEIPIEVLLDIQKWNNYIDESTRSSLINMQYGVSYKPDLAKYQPTIIDPDHLYMIYSNIILKKF